MALKRPKKKGPSKNKKNVPSTPARPIYEEREEEEEDIDYGSDDARDEEEKVRLHCYRCRWTRTHYSQVLVKPPQIPVEAVPTPAPPESDVDPDDPNLTIPIPRYNAMLSVVRNTLYM